MAQRVQMNITYSNHQNLRTGDTHLTAGVFCFVLLTLEWSSWQYRQSSFP
jgi:hypothetical protein